ncbi:hypothetical protein ACFWVC_00215 [Streptomyces sp. NPDC058691]|uniref:hypothetical protein n=1 Tax=Streptomyces sp. NPDC058691 TaxID=3346601 RepID=UPI00364BC9ED
MGESNVPAPAVRAGAGLRLGVSRAKLTVVAVGVLAAYAAGPGSEVVGNGVPMSRTAVDEELNSAAAEVGVYEATGVIMGLSFSGGSYRPSRDCMIAWSGDMPPGDQAYEAIGAALTRRGWIELRHQDNEAYANTIFGKGGWSVTVSHRVPGATEPDTELLLTATAPAC